MSNLISKLVKEISEKKEINEIKKDEDLIIHEPIRSGLSDIVSAYVKKENPDLSEKIKYGYKEILANKTSIFDYTVSLISIWFLLYFAQNFIINNIKTGGLTAYLLAFVSILIALIVCYYIANDIIGLFKINKLEKFRNNIQSFINTENVIELKNFLKQYCKSDLSFCNKIENVNNCDKLLKIFEKDILNQKDKKADEIIKKYAFLTSGATILTAKAWIDFMIMQIFFAKLIIDLAKLYNINIGLFSFIKLLYIGLIGASFSSLTTSIVAAISTNDLTKKAMEFTTTTYIVAHLGLKVKYAIRPIVVTDDDVSVSKTIKLIFNQK